MFYIAGLLIVAAIAIIVYHKIRSAETVFIDELVKRYGIEPEEAQSVAPGVEQSFYKRLMSPSARWLYSLCIKVLPSSLVQHARVRLGRAGLSGKISAPEFIGVRLLCALVGLAIGAAVARGAGFSGNTLVAIAAAFVFWLAPDLYLSQVISDRQLRVRRALPDTIDLLLVSVEAGIGFDAAMRNVVRNLKGPLSDDLVAVLRDVELGKTRMEALREMAARVGVIELGGFVAAVYEADELGASIIDVLRAQSEDLRVRRFQLAREAAQKLPVQLLFPMAFFIFPSIFVVVLGPAAIQVLRIVLQMK